MADLTTLTANSSLADLPLVTSQVDLDVSGKAVAKRFESNPSLPGILVFQGKQLAGLVSRRRFHEQISSPYGLEIFFSRPISAFLEVSAQKGRADFLMLPATEKIEAAVNVGLNRATDSVYEPIVVLLESEGTQPRHQLLDFQTLLLAQSKIMALVNETLEGQWQQNRYYMLKLDEERQRVKKYVALLEKQQHLIRDRNRILETQQVELVQKNQEIEQLNDRFVKISQLLSREGRKTFEATLMGVDGICDNTRAILTAGEQFKGEAKTVHQVSDMVARVSYQVRHLATKAAIVASHASSELSGFTQIAEEISKLVDQTYQAGQQLERVAHRFGERVKNLAAAANSGTTIARSLAEDMSRMQDAIAQLEELIEPASASVSPVTMPDTAPAPLPIPADLLPPPPVPRAHDLPPAAIAAPTAEGEDAQALLELLSQAETILARIDKQFQGETAQAQVQQFRQKLSQTRNRLS